MRHPRFPTILLLLVIAAGCDGGSPADAPRDSAGPTGTGPTSTGTPAGPAPSADGAPGAPTADPPDRPPGTPPVPAARTAYGWGVPTAPARISHPDRPPAPPPPAPPLPYLVRIEAADHAEDEPGYGRISFTFRGGFPSYHLEYVSAVRLEGTGEAIPLPGNAFLRVRFVQAQAHDERGIWTVTATPRPELGYRTLLGYGFAGDFEGYLSYGLGVQVPPDSDGALPVRAVEVTRPDGTFVIAVDVRHG